MTPFVLAAALLLQSGALADDGPPIVTPDASAAASAVAHMSDSDPTSRMLQVLAAKDLARPALFVLASSHPSVAEQLIDPELRTAVDYIGALPPAELHRVRKGETIVRGRRSMLQREREVAIKLAQSFDFPKFDPDKVEAVRLGPLEGRVYRLELRYQHKKRKALYGSVDLAWPSTPERDEQSRTDLTRHFGARPSATIIGSGATLPLAEGSFEDPDSVGAFWAEGAAMVLEPGHPRGEVTGDDSVALDGYRSVRFHNTKETRWFPGVRQEVPVPPGARVRVESQFRARNLRVEYLQREDLVGMGVTWIDDSGRAIGAPVRATARLNTHAWEPLTIEATAPPGATRMRLELSSTVSGTAWFDGVQAELR